MQKKVLLTVTEVSKILRMNKTSVYHLIRTNKLPAIKGLGAIKVKSEDLEKLLSSCYEGDTLND